MEAIGNLLHTVGEKVGLVHDEKKDQQLPPGAAAGAAPSASSAAYAEWQRNNQQEKNSGGGGGILASIGEVAKAALSPPPLDGDPADVETIVPLGANPNEQPPTTVLGNLLQTVEHKIEEAVPKLVPKFQLASQEPEEEEKKKQARVSSFGAVFDSEDTTEATRPGKLEAAEETRGPVAARRDAAMEPLVTGEVQFSEAWPTLHAEYRALEPYVVEDKKKQEEDAAVIGDWKVEEGHVKHEEENKGNLDDDVAKAKKDASGASREELEKVAAAADRIMARNAADRRTSLSSTAEELPEVRVEFAPAPLTGGFAIEPSSKAVAEGTRVDVEEREKKEEEKKEEKEEEKKDEKKDIIPEIKIEPAKEETKEEKNEDEKKQEEEKDKEAEPEIKVDPELIEEIVEANKNADVSNLPPLTPEIAFELPPATHEEEIAQFAPEPKLVPHARRPGRGEHWIMQPRYHA